MSDPRPSAKEAFPAVFRSLDVIARQVHKWLHGDPLPDSKSAFEELQLAFIVRALNQYRAIVVLLRINHWEDALIVTRSLFELVLNLEEVVLRQEDKEAAAELYFLFSELQKLLEQLEFERYQIYSGRLPKEHMKKLDAIERKARKIFAPFAFSDKKGRPRWRTHWANRKVADLCSLSPNPLRVHQYRILYARGSAFAHSAPLAVLDALVPPSKSAEDSLRLADEHEEQNLRMVASFAVLFLGEVLSFVGSRLPSFRLGWVTEVLGPTATTLADRS